MVDLQGGKATIVPVPGGMVRPDAIFNALSTAGFRGDAVTLDVKGTVRQVGGVPVLTLPGHADPYLELRAGAAPDGEVRLRIRVAPGQPAEVIERKEGAAPASNAAALRDETAGPEDAAGNDGPQGQRGEVAPRSPCSAAAPGATGVSAPRPPVSGSPPSPPRRRARSAV